MEGMSKHRRLVLFGKSLDSPSPTRSIHVPQRRIEPVGGSRELLKLPAFIPPVLESLGHAQVQPGHPLPACDKLFADRVVPVQGLN
jgi:hypothetical protein